MGHVRSLVPRLACLAAVVFGLGCREAPVLHLAAGDGTAIADVAVPIVERPALAPREKLSPFLRRAGGEEPLRALVDLRWQVDLRRLRETLNERGSRRLERRHIVVAALERLAADSQARLAPLLEDLRRRDLLLDHRGFAVVNRLLVEARPEGLRELARHAAVSAIVEEVEGAAPVWAAGDAPSRTDGTVRDAAEPQRSWALDALGVAAAWERGLDGSGVVVGLLDSGASAAHQQLAAGFVGGASAWLDPAHGRREPHDTALGHGSGVLSVAVGRNVGGVMLGVAPGARWVACAGLPEGHFNNVLLTLCADWLLRVAQPDVLINAWLLPEPGCDRSLQPMVDAWRAAEILPVFAAGNHGPAPGSDHSPANYTNLYPADATSLAIGGWTPGGELFERSAVGPSHCRAADGDGAVFPSLVAPAVDVLAALPITPAAHIRASGTSYAAGLTAGVAALLLESRPEAAVHELETALRGGAADLGAPGPDARFGHGRLDVAGALARLEALRRAR